MARGVIVSFAILVPLMSLIKVAYAHYTPTWAVHIPGGKETAEAVALEHGFINLGEDNGRGKCMSLFSMGGQAEWV
ncbi:unnamed protein product [Euphydryas editha]|uniref:Peptidase S8 pro-domain domain-containing protein n=1 Tax=Euphydryas editha TaxID=104508 RepID=A0AAU9TKG8_EUPED|nr:unnamed protein product [Euphydryas editha]